MRVALVVPSSNLNFNNGCAPTNLGFIASYLRKTLPDVEVKIFDGMIQKNIEESLFLFQPDVVGVTAVTPQAPAAYSLLDNLRRNRPDIFTVIGGIHASMLPEEALLHADCVIVGEGEKTFSDIVQSRTTGIVKSKFVQNLDDIPSPAFDLIDMKYYLSLQHFSRNNYSNMGLSYPTVALVTSRGCPYKCNFCWNSARTFAVRYFSAQRIVDEILFFHKNFGIKSVFFNDDEFLINSKRLKELSILFKKYEIDKWLTWGCQARARTINVPLLQLAKSMNCKFISIGIESGCDRILDYLKNHSVPKYLILYTCLPIYVLIF